MSWGGKERAVGTDFKSGVPVSFEGKTGWNFDIQELKVLNRGLSLLPQRSPPPISRLWDSGTLPVPFCQPRPPLSYTWPPPIWGDLWSWLLRKLLQFSVRFCHCLACWLCTFNKPSKWPAILLLYRPSSLLVWCPWPLIPWARLLHSPTRWARDIHFMNCA